MAASTMTPLDLVLSVADRGDTRQVGGQWLLHCPSHEDKHPSLAVREAWPGGTLLLFCRAGCATVDVLVALGLDFGDIYGPR